MDVKTFTRSFTALMKVFVGANRFVIFIHSVPHCHSSIRYFINGCSICFCKKAKGHLNWSKGNPWDSPFRYYALVFMTNKARKRTREKSTISTTNFGFYILLEK